jgi:hypothetical protein
MNTMSCHQLFEGILYVESTIMGVADLHGTKPKILLISSGFV